MELNTVEIGKNGEYQAVEFLRENGYRIREQNWRLGKFEIDIIAERENDIVFLKSKHAMALTFPRIALFKVNKKHVS